MAEINRPKGKSTVRQQSRPTAGVHSNAGRSTGASSGNRATGSTPSNSVNRPSSGSAPIPAAKPVRPTHGGPGGPGRPGGPGGPGRPGGPGGPGRPWRPGRPGHPGGQNFHSGSGAPPRPPRRQSIGSTLLALLLLLLILGAAIWFQIRRNSDKPADSPSSGWRTPFPVAQAETSEPDSVYPNGKAPDTSLSEDATLEVHVLDVGQGLSVLLSCGDETLLYDGGDRSTSSFVVSYLKKQGIGRLDYVVVSHYDADHLAGVIGALNVFEVGTLIAPDYQTDTKLFSSFQQTVQEKELSVTSPVPGDTYSFGAGEFQVLAPLNSYYANENDYSIVLRVCLGERSLLLTGDATENSESELLEHGTKLHADVLIVGHHGSAGSTSPEFLEAVAPSYAVISCGRDNDYGHPSERVMELLEKVAIPLYRTDLQETVIFTLTVQDVLFEKAPCEDYTWGSYAKIPGAILLRASSCYPCIY